jgi:hypothetical protein
MSNLDIWTAVEKPPREALKTIKGGRLSGMTDINPQWRYKAMTEVFGPIGEGWVYEIVRLWNESGPDGVVMAFCQINLRVKRGEHWSEPIPGIGGAAMVASEKGGLRSSDEAYKMALTDALSVAMKMIGVGSAIYEGRWDGSKYNDRPAQPITPGAGAMEKQTPEMQQALADVATRVTDLMQDGNVDGAAEYLHEQSEQLELDADGKVALWTLLRSDHRRMLKARK